MINWGRRAVSLCIKANGGPRPCSQLACSASNAGEASSGLDAITKGNPELEHKLKVIMLETEVMRQEGRLVPPQDFISPQIWGNLLKLGSRSGRGKYLEYLFKTAKAKEHQQAKKAERRQQFEAFKMAMSTQGSLSIEEHAQKYGLAANSIFLRFYDASMNHFYNGRLVKARDFGQKLVLDCGFDGNMTRRENQNAAKQLMLLFSDNRFHKDPFDIHYTNLRRESELTKMLHKIIPTMYEPAFPMNIHEGSYLDVFPKERLVYLTPHCREEMDYFDHDAIYIIGGIVDKLNNEPLSLAKAKREGLRMCKFPLDRYLQWGGGSGKSLTLNHCIRILLDLKESGDWSHALRHVPRRKLADAKPPRFRPTWKTQTSRSLYDE